MDVKPRHPDDAQGLLRRVRGERDAEQRDRLRVALLALEGGSCPAIMAAVGRSRGFVQRWAYAYRDGGIEALRGRARGGSKPKVDPDAQGRFITRFKAGPDPQKDGGVCRLGGKDAVRILRDEFGVVCSLTAAYELLHRHGLSCLRPRPRHRKNDPRAMAAWQDAAPLLSGG